MKKEDFEGKILDIGCNGHKHGDIGLDTISYDDVDYVASIYDMPFEDETFKWIYCFEIIEHLENTCKALREVRRVLKKDGTVFFSTPNIQYFKKTLTSLFNITDGADAGHINLWRKHEISRLMEKAGFDVIRFDYNTWEHHAPGRRIYRYFMPRYLASTSLLINARRNKE